MTNQPATATRITLSEEAARFLDSVPALVRDHMVKVIRAKAQQPETQMCVISWTADPAWPWIERAMKDYRFKPGIRVLFHIVKRGSLIHVDRIAYRCDDPYGDGR